MNVTRATRLTLASPRTHHPAQAVSITSPPLTRPSKQRVSIWGVDVLGARASRYRNNILSSKSKVLRNPVSNMRYYALGGLALVAALSPLTSLLPLAACMASPPREDATVHSMDTNQTQSEPSGAIADTGERQAQNCPAEPLVCSSEDCGGNVCYWVSVS